MVSIFKNNSSKKYLIIVYYYCTLMMNEIPSSFKFLFFNYLNRKMTIIQLEWDLQEKDKIDLKKMVDFNNKII